MNSEEWDEFLAACLDEGSAPDLSKDVEISPERASEALDLMEVEGLLRHAHRRDGDGTSFRDHLWRRIKAEESRPGFVRDVETALSGRLSAQRRRLAGLVVLAASFLVFVAVWFLVSRPSPETHDPLAFVEDMLRPREAGGVQLPASSSEILAAVRATSEELRWMEIPWLRDLAEAQRLAREERRPILLWTGGGGPLDRSCGCAYGLRRGPLSEDEVVGRISANFVPVALDRDAASRAAGPAGELYRSIHRQRPAYEGLWIVSPDGRVLDAHSKPPKERKIWSQAVLYTLDAGLKAFGPVEPRIVQPFSLFPHRGTGFTPAGAVSLAVSSRLIHNGRPDGPVVEDGMDLSAEEWAGLSPPSVAAGFEWTVPEALARRFCRALSPAGDVGTMPLPQDAKVAELKGVVESIQGNRAQVSLKGRWETEHFVDRKKEGPIRCSASADGVLVYDFAGQRTVSLLLVFRGTYRHTPPWDAPRQCGAVVEWTE